MLLDLVGEHLQAAAVDHRADAAVDPHEAVVVDAGEVAGAQPAVGGDPIFHRGVVGRQRGRGPDLELADLVDRSDRAVVGTHAQSNPACGRPTAPSFAAPNSFQSAALQPTTSPPSSVWP